GPVPATPARSTPRSFASFRTGGLAAGRSATRPFPAGPGVGAWVGAEAWAEGGVVAEVVSGAGAGASAGLAGAVDGAFAAPLPPPSPRRRFVAPASPPPPPSPACRSTFGAGLPWIPGSKAACRSAPAGVEVAAVTGSVTSAADAATGSAAPVGDGVVVTDA